METGAEGRGALPNSRRRRRWRHSGPGRTRGRARAGRSRPHGRRTSCTRRLHSRRRPSRRAPCPDAGRTPGRCTGRHSSTRSRLRAQTRCGGGSLGRSEARYSTHGCELVRTKTSASVAKRWNNSSGREEGAVRGNGSGNGKGRGRGRIQIASGVSPLARAVENLPRSSSSSGCVCAMRHLWAPQQPSKA